MSVSLNIGKILDVEVDRNYYFDILGCSENSTAEQIAVEYRIRALKCHPDKNPGNEEAHVQFQKLQEAKDILTDPDLRRQYDRWRQCEMCIPFKTWLSMQNRCTTTMHWAKPKAQTMLEGGKLEETEVGVEDMWGASGGPLPTKTSSTFPAPDNLKLTSRKGWESDSTSSVYSQFRNYKI